MDLLKACQREGLVRIERDRRGGLRVFQGAGAAEERHRAAGTGRDHRNVAGHRSKPSPATSSSTDEPVEIEQRRDGADSDRHDGGTPRARQGAKAARGARQAAATPCAPSARWQPRRKPAGEETAAATPLARKKAAPSSDDAKLRSSDDQTDLRSLPNRAHRVASGIGRPFDAQSRRPLQPDDIFELKTVGDPRISPDGAWVAYTVSTLDRKEDNSDTDIYMVVDRRRRTGPADGQQEARELAALEPRRPLSRVPLVARQQEDAGVTSSIAAAATRRPSPTTRPAPRRSPGRPTARSSRSSCPSPIRTISEGQGKRRGEQDKKPKPHVITRLQFMRDGDGYLNDIKRHIHVFDIASKRDLELTPDRYDDGAPVWAPDGKLIAFSANRTDNPDANDNSDIFVVAPAAGAKPRAVTTWPGSDSSPVFSPDGKSIAYLAGRRFEGYLVRDEQLALVAGRRRRAENPDAGARPQRLARRSSRPMERACCSCSKRAATCTSRGCRPQAARSSACSAESATSTRSTSPRPATSRFSRASRSSRAKSFVRR